MLALANQGPQNTSIERFSTRASDADVSGQGGISLINGEDEYSEWLRDFWRNPDARNQLLEKVDAHLRCVARHVLNIQDPRRQHLETSELVQTVFRRILSRPSRPAFRSLAEFYAYFAAAARSALVDKFISHEQASRPDARARFRREQEVLGKLKHRHIIQALDAPEWDGFELLVMDFIEGLTLDALVQEEGPLDAQQACELARQIADGLRHAHEKGIIHRDLKPRNVMLTTEDDVHTVKILDFGVAGLVRPDGMTTSLTESGAVVGTLPYMAPEVMDGGLATQRGWRKVAFACGCGVLAAIPLEPARMRSVGTPSGVEQRQPEPLPPEAESLRPVSFPELLDTILASLDNLPGDECHDRRFLDLTSLGRHAANHQTARRSLVACRRVLNLIPGTRPVDDQGLIYMVALSSSERREAGTDWTGSLWICSCTGCPYAFDFKDPKYVALKDLIASKEPGRDLPILRGDWLLARWSAEPNLRPETVSSLDHDLDLRTIKDGYDEKLSRRDAANELWLASEAQVLSRLTEVNNAYPFYEAGRLIEDGRLDRAAWDGSRWRGRDSLWQKVAEKLDMGMSLPFAIPQRGAPAAAEK